MSKQTSLLDNIPTDPQIAKDADIVLLCKWPYLADKEYQDKYEYWIACAKNRNRGIREGGAVKLRIEPRRQRLVEEVAADMPNYEPAFEQQALEF